MVKKTLCFVLTLAMLTAFILPQGLCPQQEAITSGSTSESHLLL